MRSDSGVKGWDYGAPMLKRAMIVVLISVVALAVILAAAPALRRMACGAWQRICARATVADRLEQYGPAARERLGPYFEAAGVTYPPAQLTLIGIKDTKVLEVWARSPDSPFRLIRTYPILGASGQLGPKLREGDRQVPEGIYAIEFLNPNSMFHLALRLDYPNAFDRQRGAEDGRDSLGGDIMIHGSSASVGCLAMGNEAVEDLFVLAAETGADGITVILAPVDLRTRPAPVGVDDLPGWTERLYTDIGAALAAYRRD